MTRKRNTGNQHRSRRRDLIGLLDAARYWLKDRSALHTARGLLQRYHIEYALAPASTRRRWKCGR